MSLASECLKFCLGQLFNVKSNQCKKRMLSKDSDFLRFKTVLEMS